MLEIKNTLTEMKDTFDWLIHRLNMAQERISDHEDISLETSKTKEQREKKAEENQNRLPRNCETTTKILMYV